MQDILYLLLIFGVWIVLVRFIFPKIGIRG